MHDWWEKENVQSIDGLPGLEEIKKMQGREFKSNWVRPDAKKSGASSSSKSTSTAAGAGKKKDGKGAGQATAIKLPIKVDDQLFNGFVGGVLFAALVYYVTNYFGISL